MGWAQVKEARNGIEEDILVNNGLGNIFIEAYGQKGFTVTGHGMGRQSDDGDAP